MHSAASWEPGSTPWQSEIAFSAKVIRRSLWRVNTNSRSHLTNGIRADERCISRIACKSHEPFSNTSGAFRLHEVSKAALATPAGDDPPSCRWIAGTRRRIRAGSVHLLDFLNSG